MITQPVITSIILLKYSFYLTFQGKACFVNMLHFIVLDLQVEQLCYGKQRTEKLGKIFTVLIMNNQADVFLILILTGHTLVLGKSYTNNAT